MKISILSSKHFLVAYLGKDYSHWSSAVSLKEYDNGSALSNREFDPESVCLCLSL